jgi:hypothetical protein
MKKKFVFGIIAPDSAPAVGFVVEYNPLGIYLHFGKRTLYIYKSEPCEYKQAIVMPEDIIGQEKDLRK